MKKVLFILVLLISGQVHAGKGVAPSMLQYHDWAENKPNVITVISGNVGGYPLWFKELNVKWVKIFLLSDYQSTLASNKNWSPILLENMGKQLCDLVNRAWPEKCITYNSSLAQMIIVESYLGSAEKFIPDAVSNEHSLGTESLSMIPAGAKRVLRINVVSPNRGGTYQVAVVAFDDNVSDDDLRQIALEDGVYRVMGWRED